MIRIHMFWLWRTDKELRLVFILLLQSLARNQQVYVESLGSDHHCGCYNIADLHVYPEGSPRVL